MHMKSLSLISSHAVLCALAVVVQSLGTIAIARPSLDLAGRWAFRLDPNDAGIENGWSEGGGFPDAITLPGSLQTQGFGEKPSLETAWSSGIGSNLIRDERYAKYTRGEPFISPFFLTPDRHYVGAAWYARDIEIPRGWNDRSIELTLERPHWQTTVWIDGVEIGSRDGIGVPHRYVIGEGLTPGTHRVVIRVDNRMIQPIGRDAHAISDQTQSNWNGIVGDLTIEAFDRAWSLDPVRVTPDVAGRSIRVDSRVSGERVFDRGTLTLDVIDSEGRVVATSGFDMRSAERTGDHGGFAFTWSLPEAVQHWDEFNPAVYTLRVGLIDDAGEQQDDISTTFGLREITTDGTRFLVNGEPTLMRGALDCAIFPDTGYPPTDVESWLEIFGTVKAFGLNHIRFHTWCPPKAAFVAADRLGVYLQPEVSTWPSLDDGNGLEDWLKAEGDRMLRAYGNHPSFAFLCVGNEMWGNGERLWTGSDKVEPLVMRWRERDPRRLYSVAAGWPTAEASEYHIPQDIRLQLYPGLRLADPPRNDLDYRAFVERFDRPIISHEIGQWTATPDPEHAEDFKGFLRADYHSAMEDMAVRGGIDHLTDAFVGATGAFQTLLYKAEIEAALRTPGLGGFQLLGLQDFTGQGVAPVGVVDAFWKPKPYITAEQYRRFAGPTVLLSRMDSFIWHTDETFEATIDLAHYGPGPVESVCTYELVNDDGDVLASGQFDVSQRERGIASVGAISVDLSSASASISAPVSAELRASLADSRSGSPIENSWRIWVYPRELPTEPNADAVHIARALDEAAIDRLRSGGRVALFVDPERVEGDTFGTFRPIFWNRVTFSSQREHVVGLLIDDDHPALDGFPTETHQDWQWWDVMSDSKPMPMGFTATPVEPIVRAVDDWYRARGLSLAFECLVPFEADTPPGRLLVCSIDLHDNLENRPATRQLRSSLLRYAASDAFAPTDEIPLRELRRAFREPSAMQAAGVLVTASSSARGYGVSKAIDGSADTFWHTPWGKDLTNPPHTLRIDLGNTRRVSGLVYTPRQDMSNGRIGEWAVEVSDAGYNWRTIAEGVWPNSKETQRVSWEPTEVRFVRLVAKSSANEGAFASAAEIEVTFAEN